VQRAAVELEDLRDRLTSARTRCDGLVSDLHGLIEMSDAE
jgi:hypothetical protein